MVVTCSQLKRGLVIAGFGAIAIGAASASAKASSPPGTPFADAFKAVFQERAARLLSCVGPSATGGLTPVTVLGAPPPAEFLSDSRRRDLNDAAMRAIDATGAYRAQPAEPTRDLAPLLQGTVGDVRLQKTLAAFSDAPVILKFRLKRPGVNSLHVQIDLHGRNPEGAYSCTQTAGLYLHPATLETVEAPKVDQRLFHLDGAFRDALRKLIVQVRASERIAVLGETTLTGTCALKNAFLDSFGATYFSLKRDTVGLGELDAPWPQVSIGRASDKKSDPQITLRISESPIDPTVVTLVTELTQNNNTLDLLKHRAVVDPSEMEGCPEAVQEDGEHEKEPEPQQTTDAAGDTAEPKAAEAPSDASPSNKVADASPPAPTSPSAPPAEAPSAPKLIMGREDPSLVFYSEKSVYKPTERIWLFVRAPQDCRLTLINVDDEGKSCIMFPHAAFTAFDQTLPAGETFKYPPKGAMRAPTGRFQKFIALCNATDGAKTSEVRDTVLEGACTTKEFNPDQLKEFNPDQLETILIDPNDVDDLDNDRSTEPKLMRRSIVVRITP